MTLGFTGIRWGELVGLETKYVRPGGLRVEWQLYELDNGQLHRSPPKDESRRTVAVPDLLVELLSDHVRRTGPVSARATGCVTSTPGIERRTAPPRIGGPRLADVAQRAAVAVGTVSAVLIERG